MTAKRIFDCCIATLALIVLLPVMGVLAIAVKLSSPGEVLYRAKRVGRFGRPFYLYKLRTMVTGADRLGPLITGANDPRITSLGRYLRKSKLDELPSLWNVLTGEMSLVGPRPENERSVAQYNQAQRRVLAVRPGLTSLATLKYRNEESLLGKADDLDSVYYSIMQDKLALDLEYIGRSTLGLDLKILLLTVVAIFRS
jgi:lipopolysaccharide/colanic/teichoic acid biosynthesis glycosyltransferase